MPTLNQLNLNATGGQVTLTTPNNPIIEPLDGLVAIDTLLGAFPENLYSRSRDSHLYKLLTALCGEAGAGQLKKATLLSRLKNEAGLLNFDDVDSFYGSVLNFHRLKSETYSYVPQSSALEKEVWDKIMAADRSYHKRIVQYTQSTRYGNSPAGIALAAQSAAGLECEVVENYRYVFDQFSDDRLGIIKVGNTDQVEEFVILPQVIDNINNSPQTLDVTIGGDITGGTFDLNYAGRIVTITYGATSEQVTELIVDNLSDLLITYQEIIDTSGNVSIVEQSPAAAATSGLISTISDNPNTYQITFNVSTVNIFDFTATNNLSGTNPSVTLTYPTNDNYYIAQFAGPRQIYADKLKRGDPITPADQPFVPGITIMVSPELEKNIVNVVDKLRPAATSMSVNNQTDRYIEVAPTKVFASSERLHISRFVTGKSDVAWPEINAETGTFIANPITTDTGQQEIESEATYIAYNARAIPIIYHTIQSVVSYTNAALSDPDYNNENFLGGTNPSQAKYRSIMFAPYSAYMSQRFPTLVAVVSNTDIFWDYYSLARPDTPFILGSNPFSISANNN